MGLSSNVDPDTNTDTEPKMVYTARLILRLNSNNQSVNLPSSLGRVMCSPLTRAVQTALVACAGLPALGAGLNLLRNLREIEKFGSVGKYVGPVCVCAWCYVAHVWMWTLNQALI